MVFERKRTIKLTIRANRPLPVAEWSLYNEIDRLWDLHREDGPAIIIDGDIKSWFRFGWNVKPN